jgi:hypothetical protein
LGDEGAPTVYEANATVIDAGGAPELCLGSIADSLPPQCGGIELRGWNWSNVSGEQHASGTTWGEYHVVGSFQGSSFSVSSASAGEPPSPDGIDPFRSPCPEPVGGWVDEDPSRTSDDDRLAAMHVAEDSPDHTGVWIDNLHEDAGLDGPSRYVLNATFTADLPRHERDLRAVWGGPLCVSASDLPFSELSRIQKALSDGGTDAVGLKMTWSNIDVMAGRVELGVVLVTPEMQAAVDEAYGVGTVRVVPAMTPVSEGLGD